MICTHCDQSITLVAGEWVDAVGAGCAGRGGWGEVLPHQPRDADVLAVYEREAVAS